MTSSREPECYTDYALQEYLMGRLDVSVRQDVQRHLDDCKECASRYNQYMLEKETIRNILSSQPSVTSTNLCIDDEALAMFLDNSLDEESRARCEAHLAVCKNCYAELLQIHNQLDELLSGEPNQAPEKIEQPPMGLILKMPKRTSPPKAYENQNPESETGTQ